MLCLTSLSLASLATSFLVASLPLPLFASLIADLRIADKRNEEVKAKYDVVANILDASCEKVNTLVCCLCALTIWDEEGQNEVIDALNNYGRIDLVEQSKNGAGEPQQSRLPATIRH